MLETSLQALLRREGVADNVEISLVLCDDAFIQQLNATYRGQDKPTDVLSFAQEEEEAPEAHPSGEDPPRPRPSGTPPQREGGLAEGSRRSQRMFKAPTTDCVSPSPLGRDPVSEERANKVGGSLPRVLGDIVISIPTAERQAAKAGWELESEVVLLAVHGLLHLLGYNDETETGAAEMQRKTVQALSDVGIILPEGTHPFFVEYE